MSSTGMPRSSRDFNISSAMCFPVMCASLLNYRNSSLMSFTESTNRTQVVRSDLISHNTIEHGLFDILNNALEYDVFCHS